LSTRLCVIKFSFSFKISTSKASYDKQMANLQTFPQSFENMVTKKKEVPLPQNASYSRELFEEVLIQVSNRRFGESTLSISRQNEECRLSLISQSACALSIHLTPIKLSPRFDVSAIIINFKCLSCVNNFCSI